VSRTTAYMKSSVTRTELLVLEKDGGVGVGIGMRSVVSHGDEGVRFGFFFLFALDELDRCRDGRR